MLDNEDDVYDNDGLSEYAGEPLESIKIRCPQIVQNEVLQFGNETDNINTNTIAIGIIDFLKLDIPIRKTVLYPFIPEKGLVMLYAARGMGKTWGGLEIGYTVASGNSMFDEKWSAPEPQKVLYVDGEMPASVLQERFAKIASSRKDSPTPENDYLKIISADLCENGIPDLSTQKGQAFIEAYLTEVKLLILDNLSCLCNSGEENKNDSWQPMQDWLLSLRRRGISVLFIHHAGKGGGQRGNSKKEDIVDSVVAFKRPADYEAEHGARFEVHYEKSRGFSGDDAKPFEAHLVSGDSGMCWKIKDLENSRDEQIVQLKAEGLTHQKIANQLGTSKSTVSRALNK